MVPVVDVSLRLAVEGFLAQPFSLQRVPSSGMSRTIRSIAPDFKQFRDQRDILRKLGRRFKTALFRDEDDLNAILPVLIAPDLTDVEGSEDTISDALQSSGIQVDAVDAAKAEKVFVDRVSEFLEVKHKRDSSRTAAKSAASATHVNSNRSGDTVLYCKGFFVSTANAFGVSTPASRGISAGRYSFGILDGGRQRFEGVLWTCPTTVRLNLP